ncbi:CoxG family protein [Pseudonocardia sp. CA-107938]|uniref:CoxG family protein n=1 Tax=Pseudonocardia sp. CA-107938 TaxID=3240021 RepID=UPI003D8A8C8A
MARFSAVNSSEAVVAAPRQEIWAVLTDPVVLPQLTPLLRRIDVAPHDPDLWTWQMVGLSVLGVGISPVFTERMRFTTDDDGGGVRIDYTHEPPAGARETTAAEGLYLLSDVPGGTRLRIHVELAVELPLPRLSAPAVTPVMQATIRRMGERFAANLLRHLGVTEPPAQAAAVDRSRSGSR